MTTGKMEIAVRLYENNKYGSTYGKGLYHSAMFNGTADVTGAGVKYLLDFYPFSKWQNTAKDELDMDAVHAAYDLCDDNTLVSWVLRYDPITRQKEKVTGVGICDFEKNQITLCVSDAAMSLNEYWELDIRPCKVSPGTRAPQLLATNADLGGYRD